MRGDRRVRRIVACLCWTSLAAGLLVAPTASAAPAAGPKPFTYALPTGGQVQVSGDGVSAHFTPAPGHSATAFTSVVNGRLTVVPADALAHATSLDAFRVGPAARAFSPAYQLAMLHVKALDRHGKPVQAAEFVVINTDDPARAAYDGVMVGGDSRIQVPLGNYSVAVAGVETNAAGAPVETDLLTRTDLAVTAVGATVSFDARTAPRVAFSTPLPSVFESAAVSWDRGTATRLDSLHVTADAGAPLYLGGAAKPVHGVLQSGVVGRQVSPPSAASPYDYVIGVPKTDSIPATQPYPVAASSLATIDASYPTDLPAQDILLRDSWAQTKHATGDLPMPDLPDRPWHAPSSLRHYVSATPQLSYGASLVPNRTGEYEGVLSQELTLKPGEHRVMSWRGGVTVPAPSTTDGPCFLCRDGDTLHAESVMDTDVSGDAGQWSEGTTTLTQDGKGIYSGSVMGASFDVDLPAAKHRYEYSMDTTHDTGSTAIAGHTRITWGFDSAQAKAPVPILYATTEFAADPHYSVGPGGSSVAVTFQHQPGAPDPAVGSAKIEVSYDGGKTWLPTAVTLTDAHHARGTWQVPAETKPGYLALRVSGVDTAGSTLQETVEQAALVNAPNGIASSATPSSPQEPTAGSQTVCADAAPGHARCLALARSARWQPAAATLPDGLARNDLLSAYRIPSTGGAGRTVAIVDSFDDPTAEADLAVYRKTYGLPACTTSNGCFKKVNGHGKSAPLPIADEAWSDEISLDLDMVSAVCPACHIQLVEADDDSTAALGTAAGTATTSGAVAVSNSWSGDENTENAALAGDFRHPGVAVTASSGDSGFRQPSWPASLSGVIAVGGTSLTKTSTGRGWAESAWTGAGSSCSAYSAKPSWQHDTHCLMRTVSDISAVADPKTGVAVYDQGDWRVFGGTSASSPIIASMIALAGNSAALAGASHIYSHASALNDVTSGGNPNWDCGGDYLCQAGTGYDGPTGLGTPNGLGAL